MSVETARRRAQHTLEVIAQDTRYALRSLAKTPTFTAVIVATLALGLGVNAAVFSLLDRLFARPPAGVQAPGELHRLYLTRPWLVWAGAADRFDYPAWRDLEGAARDAGIPGTTAYGLDSVRLGNDPHAPRVIAAFVDQNYWQVLGARVAVGRTFTRDETQIESPVNLAIVSDAFWRRELGARRDIIGTDVEVGRLKYRVVGVAARGFDGVDLDDVALWLPLGAMPMPRYSPEKAWYQTRSGGLLHIVARVPSGIVLPQLESRLTAAYRPGAIAYHYRGDSAATVSTGPILSALGPREPDRAVLLAKRLAIVSLLVLVIACANVANLLLARAVQRRREIAVRLALGISRWRLGAQVMIESTLLALGAGVAATLAGAWTGVALRRMLLPQVHWSDAVLDWRIAALTTIAALFTAFVTGLAPLAQARRLDLVEALKAGRDATLRGKRLRSSLVAAQTAFAVALLVGAGLFVRSLHRALGVDVGYDVARIVHAEPTFVDDHGGDDEVRRSEVGDRLAEVARRVVSSPAVESVALAYFAPMGGYAMTGIKIPGIDSIPSLNGDKPTMTMVAPEYAAVTGMSVVRGRFLTASDVQGAPPVMIVNEAMARTVWPGADPIGKCVEPYGALGLCYTVVGVVRDAHRESVAEKPLMQFFLPLAQATTKGGPGHASSLVVRARPEHVAGAAAALERTIREVMPAAVPNVATLSGTLEVQYHVWRTGTTLFSTLGVLALIVAALGVYGAISYDVGQRTHEMGIRIALGARYGEVVQLVVGTGVRTVAVGLAAGLGFALAGGRLISALLYDTSAADPMVFLAVAVVMLCVAAFASIIPASRAAAIDPATALRAE
ncbi:MAG: ADOP family duplicated permease [Gemmatimonadaceae bacterium]